MDTEISSLMDGASGRARCGAEMSKQQGHVLSGRAPNNIECIANEWHSADNPINGDIRQHPRHQQFRCAQSMRFPDDVEGHRGGDRITYNRDETDQCVEPKTNFRSRHHERCVEQSRERIYARDAVRPRGLTCQDSKKFRVLWAVTMSAKWLSSEKKQCLRCSIAGNT